MKPAIACTLFLFAVAAHATEVLHPILPPASSLSIQGTEELDEDVYSTDMAVSLEYAPLSRISLYVDGSFRFMSYSYEYATEGYLHNYCNLHVNGFNETYAGIRGILYKNIGLDLGWRFPPGEGSQKNRFHRLNVEPFTYLQFSRHLVLGTSLRYNMFLEDKNYMPGDEIGIKASFVWSPGRNDSLHTGWKFSEVFLYQARISDSENRNLDKRFRKMDDKYRGYKMKFDATRFFRIYGLPVGIGFNYEIHDGTLFGFETGHRVGIYLQATP